MESELCNLIFIMKVLLEQVRKTSGCKSIGSFPFFILCTSLPYFKNNYEYLAQDHPEEESPPCFHVDEGEIPVSPSSMTQVSDSLQIQDALQLLEGSRTRISSLVLDVQTSTDTEDMEMRGSLPPLEYMGENGNVRNDMLSYTSSDREDGLALGLKQHSDSLSFLRPRLPTIIDEIIAHSVQGMTDYQATLSRSCDRHRGITIQLRGLGFSAFCSKDDHRRLQVKTVYNQSFPYKLFRFFQRKWRKVFHSEVLKDHSKLEERFILKDINLCLKPGKNYLILGPPASGKTSLLKAIASLLDGQSFQNDDEKIKDNYYKEYKADGRKVRRKGETCIHGYVSYDGVSNHYGKERQVRSSIIYVDQMDQHAPRLTVQETFDFAFQCKTGGTHSPPIRWHRALMNPRSSMTHTFQRFFRNMDKHNIFINVLLEGLDLHHVKNTFVGDATNVRGVSGGQRRRVSIGEMLSTSMTSSTAIFCGDEISTGLDAASSYDIVYRLCRMGSALKRTNILSLLQPSPETLKCFDEIILLSQGRLIFSGPAEEAVQWFTSLGYHRPPSIDVADFLLLVASHYDGVEGLFASSTPVLRRNISSISDTFAIPNFESTASNSSESETYDSEKLADLFKKQCRHSSFHGSIGEPRDDEEIGGLPITASVQTDSPQTRYRNSFLRFIKLNTVRSFTIWKRDKRCVTIQLSPIR
jgi:ABC-type multidrug transport system ATPase subunit